MNLINKCFAAGHLRLSADSATKAGQSSLTSNDVRISLLFSCGMDFCHLFLCNR